MMKRSHILACLLAALGFSAAALASSSADLHPSGEIPLALLKNETFLHGHPDLRWRVEGSRQLHRGDTAAAMQTLQIGSTPY